MKDNTYLFLRGTAMVENLGYKIRSYQEIIQTQKDRDLFMRVSEYGFVFFDFRKIYLNMEQPDEEIIKTLYHELGHLMLRTMDEDAADAWADRMINSILAERQEIRYESE